MILSSSAFFSFSLCVLCAASCLFASSLASSSCVFCSSAALAASFLLSSSSFFALLVSLLLLSSVSFWMLVSTSFSFSSLLLRMASSSAASLNFSSLTVVFSRVSSSSLSLVWSMVYASFGWWYVLFLVPSISLSSVLLLFVSVLLLFDSLLLFSVVSLVFSTPCSSSLSSLCCFPICGWPTVCCVLGTCCSTSTLNFWNWSPMYCESSSSSSFFLPPLVSSSSSSSSPPKSSLPNSCGVLLFSLSLLISFTSESSAVSLVSFWVLSVSDSSIVPLLSMCSLLKRSSRSTTIDAPMRYAIKVLFPTALSRSSILPLLGRPL